MNFFQSIADLQVAGDWKINITKGTGDTLIVSVLYNNEQVKDDARLLLPPMLLKGTAAELDEGFIATIQQPVRETETLFINMQQFHEQKEQAKKQSQMQQAQAVKEKTQLSDKEKKYNDAMKLVEELEAAGKHREAWMKVPDAQQYPEHADTIRERKTALAKQFAPDLFNA